MASKPTYIDVICCRAVQEIAELQRRDAMTGVALADVVKRAIFEAERISMEWERRGEECSRG